MSDVSVASPSSWLDELLDDARLVAAYGQRTEKLRDGELLTAIAAAEELKELRWTDKEVIALRLALNRALVAISPTGLVDLRSGWRPFQPKASSFGQLLFVAATLALMVFTAISTVEYNRGLALMNSVEELQREDPRAEMSSLVRQLIAAAPQETTNIDSNATLDEAHYALLDRLHQIDDKLTYITPEAAMFRGSHRPPQEILADLGSTISSRFQDLFVSPATAAAAPESGRSVTKQYNACEDAAKSLANKTYSENPMGKTLAEYYKNAVSIICAEGITSSPYDLPNYTWFVEGMRNWTTFWGLWYLPGLYGAFGAMLYNMRRFLDPTTPDPSWIKVLNRTALGAFAGVIITWFWVPGHELSEGLTSIGLTAFTLAFLIGFSIEVLFALLDRMVSSLVDLAKGSKPPTQDSSPTK